MHSRSLLAAVAALNLSACDLGRERGSLSRLTIQGVPSTIEALPSDQVFAARNTLVIQLVRDAGLGDVEPPIGSANWAVVFRAGVYEVGRQCDMYLDALFRFGREQRAAQQGLAATAGATGAILGLTNVASAAIAITAAAFGLAGSLFDAGVNSVVFAMEPSAVRNVVLQGRQAYLDSVDQQKITSRPDMLIYLQGYLTQCSPAAIEANVNNAANGSPYAVTAGSRAERQAAARLAAPALSLMQRSEAVAGPGGSAQQTAQLPAVVRPAGWREGDRPNITRSDIERIQVGLGMATANGVLDDTTRAAIGEFQRGARLRFGEDAWPETNGNLSNNTWRTLRALDPPRPDSALRGPFERAFLGNQRGRPGFTTIDPARADTARGVARLLNIGADRFDAAAAADQPDRERAALLREGVAAARGRADAPPPAPLGDPTVIDSNLFMFIRTHRPPSS